MFVIIYRVIESSNEKIKTKYDLWYGVKSAKGFRDEVEHEAEGMADSEMQFCTFFVGQNIVRSNGFR
jgi:hypothetical protein